jgi:hypothetical protein
VAFGDLADEVQELLVLVHLLIGELGIAERQSVVLSNFMPLPYSPESGPLASGLKTTRLTPSSSRTGRRDSQYLAIIE